MATSNGVVFTNDMSNRTSCVRLLKQPKTRSYKSFSEGDMLDHVTANWPRFLGAVHSIVREWFNRGKPRLGSIVDHDFRHWARALGYITKEILGAGHLLQGHRAAQQRMASIDLSWLRELVIAIQKSRKIGCDLRTSDLIEIAIQYSVVIPGVELADSIKSPGNRKICLQILGKRLSLVFSGKDSVQIDAMRIERRSAKDSSGHAIYEYVVLRENPEVPEVVPQVKSETPEVRKSCRPSYRESFSSKCNGASQTSRATAGLPETSGCGDLHRNARELANVEEGHIMSPPDILADMTPLPADYGEPALATSGKQ
jgi:hypothetical protein